MENRFRFIIKSGNGNVFHAQKTLDLRFTPIYVVMWQDNGMLKSELHSIQQVEDYLADGDWVKLK